MFFVSRFFSCRVRVFFLPPLLSLSLLPSTSFSLSVHSTHVVSQRRVTRHLAAQKLPADAELGLEVLGQPDALADAEVVGPLAREPDDAAEKAPLFAAVGGGSGFRAASVVIRSRSRGGDGKA